MLWVSKENDDVLSFVSAFLTVDKAMTRHVRERIFPGVPKTDEMETRAVASIGYLHEAVGEEFTLRPSEIPDSDDADLFALCRDSWDLSGMITCACSQFSQLRKGLFRRKVAEAREWYQATAFVCAALARRFYHCLRFNDAYDAEEAFEGSSSAPAFSEESLDSAADLDETFEVMEASLDETEV